MPLIRAYVAESHLIVAHLITPAAKKGLAEALGVKDWRKLELRASAILDSPVSDATEPFTFEARLHTSRTSVRFQALEGMARSIANAIITHSDPAGTPGGMLRAPSFQVCINIPGVNQLGAIYDISEVDYGDSPTGKTYQLLLRDKWPSEIWRNYTPQLGI